VAAPAGDVVAVRRVGGGAPHPVAVPRRLWSSLAQHASAQPDAGFRAILANEARPVCWLEIDAGAPSLDVDTPAHARELAAHLTRSASRR
jgi:CTP:molybdopterin cytidylyltransferase MocA